MKADVGPDVIASNKVSRWNDQSGNGNDAAQVTDINRPFFSTNVMGGKPAIYFPGTNNSFNLKDTIFNGVTQLEGFAVLQADSATPATDRGLWTIGPSGSAYPDHVGKIQDAFASSSPNPMQIPEISLAQPHIYNVASRSNEWTCRLNGVVHYSDRFNAVQFKSPPPSSLGNGAGKYFAGNMGEVLFFSRVLTTTERFAVETYLSQRFDLVTNPPPTPSNLTAFAVSTNQISLTWSNALSNTNVGFLVQRSTASCGCNYSDIALVRNSLSYMDTDLAAGTQYYYRLKAISYSGEAALSSETNATTLTNGITIPLASLALWLKADSGHGFGAVNCWVDQTTNNNSAYFSDSYSPGAPRWSGFNTNGHPVIAFFATNVFELPAFWTNITQAEAFLVVRSFGSTSTTNYSALWWISSASLDSRYPYLTNLVWENFGRNSDAAQINSGMTSFAKTHLYNARSAPGDWSAAFNNHTAYSVVTNTPGFPLSYSLLGRGGNAATEFLKGEMTELMIFERELTQSERDTVSTTYLNKRFNLW